MLPKQNMFIVGKHAFAVNCVSNGLWTHERSVIAASWSSHLHIPVLPVTDSEQAWSQRLKLALSGKTLLRSTVHSGSSLAVALRMFGFAAIIKSTDFLNIWMLFINSELILCF
jgi:hypothetical protein